MSEFLPEEIVVQILSRLPAKSVLKFSCVCKLWNCIIKNPNFISTFSSNKHNHYICLLRSFSDQLSLHMDNEDLDEYLSLNLPFNVGNIFIAAGCSNGLVCLYYVTAYKFIFWNPSIRKSWLINEPICGLLGSVNVTGFGFDSRTNDYKLLLARFSVCSIKDVVLYSLNSNSWKKITNFGGGRTIIIEGIGSLNTSVLVNGRFYWLVIAEKKNIVLIFDLRDETFGEISLPRCLENAYPKPLQIKAFGESSIAIACIKSLCECDIWVMKEYETCEWMKLATVGNCSQVLEFRDNGEVLVQSDRKRSLASRNIKNLASHNIKNGCIKNPMALESNETVCAYRYVESLVLLDKRNDISNEP
ncbi:F-box/kelch-repeat protein At3g06240-like [Mercurialis annua]|uniref:F-box/kelch-repeat protein At3g06240-like n=1 Tax=Mercurialis annua TaxID=3986 RepID=UPI00215F8676|nr:F-box/kelch-repeat protein At3g06240-like [Mercurialis annua]